MDDLEFRRKILAEPGDIDASLEEAMNADPAKAKFAEEIVQLDQQINSAMKVPVPDQLAANLILRQTMESHRREKRKVRFNLAIAASIAFAIGLSTNFLSFSPAHYNMSDYALAHLHHEIGILDATEGNVQLTQINAKLTDFSAEMTSLPGRIIGADYCTFDGIRGLHILMENENGKFTVFVMPKDRLVVGESQFADAQFQGVTSSHGPMELIVIGEKGTKVESVSEKVQSKMQWQTI